MGKTRIAYSKRIRFSLSIKWNLAEEAPPACSRKKRHAGCNSGDKVMERPNGTAPHNYNDT